MMYLALFMLFIFGTLALYILGRGLIALIQIIMSLLFLIGINYENLYSKIEKMKKLFILLIGIILFSGCDNVPTEIHDEENVSTVEYIGNGYYKKYLIKFSSTSAVLYTNTLYSVGDTLKISKK